MLATALTRVLSRWTGSSGLLLDVEGHGRDGLDLGVDLSGTVGWLASIHPVWLERDHDAATVAVRLAAVPHRGVSYGLARYLGDAEQVAALAAQPRAAVRLNYIGKLDALPSADAIGPMHRETGHLRQIDGMRRYVLECNAHVADGRLRLGLTYSGELHERATVERLVGEVVAGWRKKRRRSFGRHVNREGLASCSSINGTRSTRLAGSVGRPVALKVLDRELVLFRTATGVAALPDCCPHRGMRLSLGRVGTAGSSAPITAGASTPTATAKAPARPSCTSTRRTSTPPNTAT